MQAIATEEPKFYACPFVSLVHAHRGQILSGQRGRQFAGAVRRCAMAENSGNLLFDFPCNRAPVAPLTQRAASTSLPQTREKEHKICLSLLLFSGEERHLLFHGWWAESCRYVRLQAAVDETSGTEDWRPPDIEAITVRSQSRLAGQPMGIQTARRQRVMGQ